MVSQLTCFVLLGIDDRRYLEWLPVSGLRVTHLGKLRIVSLDDAEAALGAMAVSDGEAPATAAARIDHEPTTAAEVLASIGLRVVGGAR